MYEGKPYKNKLPTGWGRQLEIIRDEDYGHIEEVYRVMTH